ncbi:MAG: hypothetical protein QXQ14_00085 [Candidatus Aenigmatarchaeota archaeon]
MLVPKIITAFINIIFFIIAFSILFFILDNLPKAKIEIAFKPIYKPSNTISLCQILISKHKNCIEQIYENNLNCAKDIEQELKRFFNNFEIIFPKYKISFGKSFEEVYECKVLINSKEYSFLVKT